MITTYHRPRTLDEALTLLTQPNRIPLGGGTFLSQGKTDSIEVVDLQSLNLDFIKKSGNTLEIGAATTLQQLLDSEHSPQALKTALKLEAPLNIRNAATVAGTLVSSDGRSTLCAVLLATDARLELAKLTDSKVEKRTISVGEYFPLRDLQGSLITAIVMPINNRLAFEYVSRTPADKPVVCTALSRWNSGRTRLAVGGYGKNSLLAMDGTEAEGIEAAARNSFHEAADEWASAEYRMDVAATLAKRCLESVA